ncbi:UNVERIFIED_CONTAM: hypothetical protein PYX00_005313 [Menopon gallinae]|uniref:Uncharacterized protein n=1 Tax=Menopon gallinae TaxID=328185 RepID=A0AAW2HS41_9NEOP
MVTVHLKRRKNTMNKVCTVTPIVGDSRLKSTSSYETRKLDRKKLRNARELENCRTARSHSENSQTRNPRATSPVTPRTRSMSPTPSTPPLNADLPLKKFYTYSAKLLEQFELVKLLVSRQPEAGESLQDINRQRKRATEFAVRFSRNNLYEMKRLVNDIKQIIVPYPFENLAKCDGDVLCKKILLAYQSASQGLQTYINYMKNRTSLDVPEKTRELILLIVDLYLCCEHLSLPGDQIDILTPCRELIVILDVKIAEESGKGHLLRMGDRNKEAEEDKRYSMYRTKLTNNGWKKKTEALARLKFGAPKLSLIKKMKKKEDSATIPRATFEIYSQRVRDSSRSRRSPEDTIKGYKPPPVLPPQLKKCHVTPREVTSQDDDIETVVQGIEDEEQAVTHRIDPGGITPKNSHEKHQTHTNKNIRELVLQTIHELQSSDKCDVRNSLKKLLKSLNYPPNARDSIPPKNVKLIHIISNESMPVEIPEEVKEEPAPEPEVKEDAEVTKRKIFQTVPSGTEANAPNKRNVRMPEEISHILLKYKKMLSEYRRTNVMYKKGIPVRPCELVHRVSEQIINDILTEISSGMENENLLQHLYYNELLEAV